MLQYPMQQQYPQQKPPSLPPHAYSHSPIVHPQSPQHAHHFNQTHFKPMSPQHLPQPMYQGPHSLSGPRIEMHRNMHIQQTTNPIEPTRIMGNVNLAVPGSPTPQDNRNYYSLSIHGSSQPNNDTLRHAIQSQSNYHSPTQFQSNNQVPQPRPNQVDPNTLVPQQGGKSGLQQQQNMQQKQHIIHQQQQHAVQMEQTGQYIQGQSRELSQHQQYEEDDYEGREDDRGDEDRQDDETQMEMQIVWEHRFVEIYTKFQIFVEKFEIMIEEVYIIEDQFDSVNDQEGWNELRGRYAELMNKFNEVREDIITVLEENKKAIESLSPETLQALQNEEGNSQENEDEQTGQNSRENVWEHRYYELMQQHDVLIQESHQIKNEFEALAARKEGEASFRPNESKNNKVAELENNLNMLHSEYRELGENFAKLEEAYARAVEQLQQHENWDPQEAQRAIEGLEEQNQEYEQRVMYLEEQLRSSKDQKSAPNDQHSSVFEARIEELLEEKNILINNMNQMKREIEHYDSELLRAEKVVNDQANRIEELEDHIDKIKRMEGMNDNSLKEELDNAISTIHENERKLEEYRSVIEERERVIEDIVRNRNEIAAENEDIYNRVQDNEKEIADKIEQIEQLERRIKSFQEYEQQNTKEDKIDSSIFNERVAIEVESAVADKNRKIRSLTQELEDSMAQVEKLQKDKDKSINKIKEYFNEEEERKNKILQEKDNAMRILQDKARSLEHELSNRNLEISRFRHQNNTSTPSNDDVRKLTDTLERKNNEIQKLKRGHEQKCLEVKEVEQKIESVQHQLSSKVFEINTLKREAYEFHNIKAEIQNMNNVVKKKNQEINDLRLKVIESDQLEVTINSLEREKMRLNEHLKERSNESEAKDRAIANLEKKINSLRMEIGSTAPTLSKSTNDPMYDNVLVKQKESEIRKLKNEMEIRETTISTLEKTVKEKETKVSTQMKTNNMLKAEIENKINRYENEIKNLQKEIKDYKNNRDENQMMIDSMKSKIVSLQNSLEERNLIYDQEIALCKQKVQSSDQSNTELMIEREMGKTNLERMDRENKSLHEKVKQLQEKIDSKNKFINELKNTFTRKEKDDAKGFQEKIKHLDGELKLDLLKMRNMEELISQLSSKLKEVESEKRSYRERLLTETSGERDFEFRLMSEHYETMPNIEILEMEKFKVRDSESNNVFERKVIYDLKKENDILKRELTSMGLSSVSINRIDTQNQLSIYQQDLPTEHDKPEDDHLQYHKNVNKDLQDRIDDLLKTNKELKDRMVALSASNTNQSSVEFYKEQVSHLEAEISHLHAKIKQLLGENQVNKEEMGEYEHECESLKGKNAQLEEKISELKAGMRSLEASKAQTENSKEIVKAEMARLKEMLEKERNQVQELNRNNMMAADSKRKQEMKDEEIGKLNNRIGILNEEMERLKEILQAKSRELEDSHKHGSNESLSLKKRIGDLERELEILKYHKTEQDKPDLKYRLELLRSLFIQLESLVGEVSIHSEREQRVVEEMKRNVSKALEIIRSFD